MQVNEIEFLIYGMLLTVFVLLASTYVRRIYFITKYIYTTRKKIKEAKLKLKRYRKEGNLHKWVELPTKIDGTGLVKVCSETGWCPSNDEFYSTEQIKQVMEGIEVRKQYQEFMKESVINIAFDYNISVDIVEGIIKSASEIDQKFFKKRIDKLVSETKQM